MPEIEIRPANSADIPTLAAIDPNYTSDHVWQMEFSKQDGRSVGLTSTAMGLHSDDEAVVAIRFRQVRLPRSVRVEYPRSPHALLEDWEHRSGILVAELNGQAVGYACLMQYSPPETTWITDLVVTRALRRQGIGSSLVLAAAEWAATMESRAVVLEMQTKNYAAIQMATKLGFDFCGYNDLFYPNYDVGIFFRRML
jgi:GNAT superfamily N-acetyltransferase